ncbi:MAG TPA: hypothetical protein PKN13_13250 [Accumulibacter sp.]|nr:hypothetical protein [Accumulibacter sp.]HMW18744.1 hypothetical protein [Accumulibacter sp.]HMY06091.1 hypothetical protein [Accumulibacter sp.]HNC18771.1 hypothetical protein [Accumulibacter sp.]HND81371.1 hypothetical protein [Accumulibacter sp.]
MKTGRSAPLGKYWQSRLSVFSVVSRGQAEQISEMDDPSHHITHGK